MWVEVEVESWWWTEMGRVFVIVPSLLLMGMGMGMGGKEVGG